jgi:N-acyl amino acid synthase of PEP-CTERM/exosortase system
LGQIKQQALTFYFEITVINTTIIRCTMFDDHFEVFLADTHESKEIHYSIRYQVYCEEMGFENKDNFPRKQEFDDHDHQSAHFIARHKRTGQWVGAMRLIFHNGQSLPIEQYCTLQERIGTNDVKQSAELSRLCVVKEVRRGFVDIDPPNGIKDESEAIKETYIVKSLHNRQNLNRSIIWGLLNAATEFCYSNNIDNWYFITTNALAKVLRKGGFNMLSIGEPCYHNGERYPFKKDVVETYHNETWRKNFKNGYRIFSESDLPEFIGVAA